MIRTQKNAPSLSFLFAAFFSAIAFPQTTAADENLKPVKVYFLEALSPGDTTSSQRFQREYEGAIETGKRLTTARLRSCGYRLETATSFYDASDPLQAKEKAEAATKDGGAWLLVGPRRSNHYLLMAKGSPNTATVSLMASAQEVGELGGLHLSLSPINADLARVAAEETKARIARRNGSLTYISIVSQECVACRDFAKQFELSASRLGMKESKRYQIVGNEPDLKEIAKDLKTTKPAFILLPNYSKVSAYTINGLLPVYKDGFFVGGDGWGDSIYGFIQNQSNIKAAAGLTVRGFPPVEKGLAAFELGKLVLKEDRSIPWSGPSLAILRSIEAATRFLCAVKPESSQKFTKAFEEKGRQYFSAPWGVSVYELGNSELTYLRSKKL